MNINCRQDFFPHLSLRKMEEEKRRQAHRCKAISSANAAKFFAAGKNQNNNNKEEKKELLLSNEIMNKSEGNELNTVPGFDKVYEILSRTVEQAKNLAKEYIKEEKGKEEQIEQIKKVTKEAIEEINNLTKLVMEESNALIEKINKNIIKTNNNNDDNDIFLKEFLIEQKEQNERKGPEDIHYNIICHGCKMNPIKGNRYKNKGFYSDFDACENCYQKIKNNPFNKFIKIEKKS